MMRKGVIMYPKLPNKDKIKFNLLDKIDDLFEFILICVRSLKNPKSLSSFLDKRFHI